MRQARPSAVIRLRFPDPAQGTYDVAKRNKSALKANRQNIKRREVNRQLRSQLRTGLKKLRPAAAGDNPDEARTAFTGAQSLVDKMAAKGIIHANTAARYKSRLAARSAK
jgi:small subunit ribosomal protein S20